jgi:hypothetical protein
MIAWLYRVDDPMEPFGEPARDAFIGNRRLQTWQDDACSAHGLAVRRVASAAEVPADGAACLVAPDNLWFTGRALRGFLRRTRGAREPLCAALPPCLYMERFGALQDAGTDGDGGHVFPLWYLPAGGPPPERARPVRIPFREKQVPMAVPRHIMGFETLAHPVTTSLFMRVQHWAHVLWANILSVQVRWVEWIVAHPVRTLWRLATSLRPGRGRTFWAAARAFNNVGPGCDVHPTACVEGSILGRGVRIGAFSLVRGSLLGDGVVIEERANVNFSVLGDRCFVSKNSTLVACAGYAGGDLCVNGMQFCLAGHDVALTSWVRALDSRPRGEIRVMFRGALQPIGTPALGCAFGHRAYVGPDVYIQPGRIVPNDAFIVLPPGHALSRIPTDLPPGRASYVVDGRLEPYPG